MIPWGFVIQKLTVISTFNSFFLNFLCTKMAFFHLPNFAQEGFLWYEPMENLSEFTRLIIYAMPYYIKNILGLEKSFSQYRT